MIHAAGFGAEAVRPIALAGWHPAARLAALALGLGTGLACGWVGAGALLAAVAWGLARSGLSLRGQVGLVGGWWPLALLLVAIHTLTATGSAPLGHPSWQGLLNGGLALVRLAGALLALGLYLRLTTMDDMVGGLQWWLRPLGRCGVPVADLGLVMAVALGTVPVVVEEGRRLQAVTRLRRSGPAPVRRSGRRLRAWRPWSGPGALVVPLLEGLARRADAVSLSLRRRRPLAAATFARVPTGQALLLGLWCAGLAAYLVGRPGGGGSW